jgi:elongator complex protein 1
MDADYVFDITHGSTSIPDDVGATAVIDGSKYLELASLRTLLMPSPGSLKLTPLRLAGVPPPMAHNELALESNAIDVAFSKSGTRIAVLMDNRFSIFLWSLKSRPVPVPILESSYPLSDDTASRPRQIAFLNDNEVYVLKDNGPNSSHIERTNLETRATESVHQAADSEQFASIFAGNGHQALWFSHAPQPTRTIVYSSLEVSSEGVDIVSWAESPNVDSHWARAVSISDHEVRSFLLPILNYLLTLIARFDHDDENRWFVCKQASACTELHIFPCDSVSSFVHHFPAPLEVCSFEPCGW